MAGPMVGPILDRLPVELITTYWEPDGEFPDHEPNPLLPENREFIIRKVIETGADLGIAWDGDADRCFFIDGAGEFVPGDFLTALLAASVLEKVPGADILYDVRASRAVPDTVTRLGGRAVVNRVGHAFFKTRMRDEGGEFGGEVSGHYYFKAFYNADSGTIPALLILELLSKRETTLAELLAELRSKYFISGEINSTVDDQRAKMDEIKAAFADAEITELDGVSIDYEDWHFNVRPSNTEPLLRLNLESLISQAGHGAPARRVAGADPLVIHRLPIPTPFRIGRVNCYLIEDDPLTLVDVGPNSGESLTALEAALREHSQRVEDLERIVITHHHSDHLGLVGILAERSGAEVCALDLLAPVVEDFGAYAERNDELAQALMRRHGIGTDVVTVLAAVSKAYRGWSGSAPVQRRLTDGGELGFASRTFEVLHRPGHSPGDTVFFDAARRDAARRRPPDQEHLVEPADLRAAAGRARRARC